MDDKEDIEDNWLEVRHELTPADTEEITDQLGVMGKAQIVYSDETIDYWDEEICGKYEMLIEAFGGEDEVQQYYDIGDLGVTVAVEQEDSPLFVVYGDESSYAKSSGPLAGLASIL